MKKIIGLIWILVLLLPAIVTAATGWLHTDGRWIMDETGQEARFRGVMTFVWIQNSQEKFNKIKEAGFNTVRLAIRMDDVENPGTYTGTERPPAYDRRGLAAIDDAVRFCKNAGLMVILDQQLWNESIADPAADVKFFSDPALQEQWLSFWRLLASRYKNESTVVGIDLMNEPYAINYTDYAGEITRRLQWEQIVRKAVAELRPINPNVLFVVAAWGKKIPAQDYIDFLKTPGIVYTGHIYYEYSIPVPSWAEQWVKDYGSGNLANATVHFEEYLQRVYGVMLNQGIPVYVGETGFHDTMPNWHAQMEDSLNTYEKLGLGYTIFVYGVARWHLYYDLVDSNYILTPIGQEISDYIKSFMGNPDQSIPGDIDSDVDVDVYDLIIVVSDFGKTTGLNNPKSDTNSDGIVDIFDVVYVASRFT